MIRRWLLVASLLLFAATGRAQDTTDTLRIVTCAPSLAEYVHVVGAFDKVVGVSRFTEYPPEAKNLPAVTDMMSPGLEGIEALRPNLILCLQSNDRVAEYFKTRPGVKVVQFGEIETFADVATALIVVGRECGRERAGVEAAEKLSADIAALRASAPKRRVSVLMILGGPELPTGGVTAVGRGTFLNELLEMAGGENVLDASLGKYPALNKEALLSLDLGRVFFFVEKLPGSKAMQDAVLSWKHIDPSLFGGAPTHEHFVCDSRTMVPGPRALEAIDSFREGLAMRW